MLEKIFLIKYFIEVLFDDEETKDIIVIGLIVHIIASIATNNVDIVSNFALWWTFNNIAEVGFFVIPVTVTMRSIWGWLHIDDLFTKEEMEEIEEVL